MSIYITLRVVKNCGLLWCWSRHVECLLNPTVCWQLQSVAQFKNSHATHSLNLLFSVVRVFPRLGRLIGLALVAKAKAFPRVRGDDGWAGYRLVNDEWGRQKDRAQMWPPVTAGGDERASVLLMVFNLEVFYKHRMRSHVACCAIRVHHLVLGYPYYLQWKQYFCIRHCNMLFMYTKKIYCEQTNNKVFLKCVLACLLIHFVRACRY
jgi:hypothetical protein